MRRTALGVALSVIAAAAVSAIGGAVFDAAAEPQLLA